MSPRKDMSVIHQVDSIMLCCTSIDYKRLLPLIYGSKKSELLGTYVHMDFCMHTQVKLHM